MIWKDTFASLDATRFGTSVAGNGTVGVADGRCITTTNTATDAAILYVQEPVDTSHYGVYTVRARPVAASSGQANYLLAVMNGTPEVSGWTTFSPKRMIFAYKNASNAMVLAYHNAAGTLYYWIPGTASWSTAATGSGFGPTAEGQDVTVNLLVDPAGPRWCFEVYDGSETYTLTRTTWVAFSATRSGTPYIFCGDPLTDYAATTLAIDYVSWQSSPSAEIGFYNGKSTSPGYRIARVFTLDRRRFYRYERDALFSAPSGATDVKDPYPVYVGATLYVFYSALYSGEWRIGYCTSDDDGATLVDRGTIITKAGSGWRQVGTAFPCAYHDGSTWHIYCRGVDAAGVASVGYLYGSSLASLTEGDNPIITKVAGSTWRENWAVATDVLVKGSTVFLLVAGGVGTGDTYKSQSGWMSSASFGGPFTELPGNPKHAATLAFTTLSGAEAAGQVELSVTSTAPFSVGMPVILGDASKAETNRVVSIGAGVINVAHPIKNTYSAGARIGTYDSRTTGCLEGNLTSAIATCSYVTTYLQESTGWFIGNVFDPSLSPPLAMGSTWDTISAENIRVTYTEPGLAQASVFGPINALGRRLIA